MGKFNYNKEVLSNLRLEDKDTHLLDRLLDYDSAREAHAKKDHTARDKRMSLPEAIKQYVKPGDIIVLTAGIPIAQTGTTNMLKVHVVGEKILV
jgi:pyruvate kinase